MNKRFWGQFLAYSTLALGALYFAFAMGVRWSNYFPNVEKPVPHGRAVTITIPDDVSHDRVEEVLKNTDAKRDPNQLCVPVYSTEAGVWKGCVPLSDFKIDEKIVVKPWVKP